MNKIMRKSAFWCMTISLCQMANICVSQVRTIGVKSYDAQEIQVIESLEKETYYFCSRDLDRWASYWLQRPSTHKYYVRNCNYEELKGFDAVEAYARTYFSEHPEPEEVPIGNYQYEIEVDGNAAWVYFEVADPIRGFKKEFRYMLYKDGKWKIASMGTVYPE